MHSHKTKRKSAAKPGTGSSIRRFLTSPKLTSNMLCVASTEPLSTCTDSAPSLSAMVNSVSRTCVAASLSTQTVISPSSNLVVLDCPRLHSLTDVTVKIQSSSSDSEYDSDNESLPSMSSLHYESDHDSNSEDVESRPSVIETSMQTSVQILPFPSLSAKWYKQQYTLAVKNAAREKRRESGATQRDVTGNLIFVNRSQVKGTLEENIAYLREQCHGDLTRNKQQHLLAMIAVGEFVTSNGPVVKTQEVGHVYIENKYLTTAKLSMEFYEIFCKHLNLVQVYMFGRAFVIQNSCNVEKVVDSLKSVIDEAAVVKKVALERLQNYVSPCLRYMDTHRDRQVLTALTAELTSISCASQLQGIQSRKGVRNAMTSLQPNLQNYIAIRKTSQVVRSDLTTLQQHKLTERIISSRKLKEIRTIAEGRGRKLKCSAYPELSTILSYAFGEYDRREGGGGVEAHPRLTTGTLYRASDCATTMKVAREVLLSLAPAGFDISLSSCYNYTENYRKGSTQAKQHHFGRDVNAPLSLKRPPRIGVEKFVVNLHWSTANVNLIIDNGECSPHCLVVSKDAKAIILADAAPVQRPGHSWSRRFELPDHTWDQSRTNAITPMTFLFLQTQVEHLPISSVQSLDLQVSDTTTLHLTRTGQGVTLLNLSFFEPETTFKCLNEILYLLTLPALDDFFRDKTSGSLKKEFVFVVDNGPAEQPCSSLVQMCLIRLLLLLKLDRITQVSFAEYHSKRNFVERVHAEENRVLAKHGPFSSKAIHQHVSTGGKEHIENMENMAEKVRKCINQASFGGKQMMCYRGVKPEDSVFTDDKALQTFLSLNEEEKQQFSPSQYHAKSGEILSCLSMCWGVDEDFKGTYISDHHFIHNELGGSRTAWKDKYTTSLYSLSCEAHHELQPIPDYLRWFKTGELHYMPLDERKLLLGPWDDIPAAFLPSRVLDCCFSILQETVLNSSANQLALLSWTTPHEVCEYQKKIYSEISHQLKAGRERERWKLHALYQTKNKAQLEALCRDLRIPVTSALQKHQLARFIVEKKGEPLPPEPPQLYNGKLSTVPTTTSALGRLTVNKLRSILLHHEVPPFGTKEQLIFKVYLLRHNRSAAVTTREENQIKDLIRMAKKVILEQRKLDLSTHVYRKRKYALRPNHHQFVPIPSTLNTESDLQSMFEPLLLKLEDLKQLREAHDEASPFHPPNAINTEGLMERIAQTGAKVKIKWVNNELDNTGWKPGWYSATVHKYVRDTDMITITYASEPGVSYEEELLPLVANNKINLLWSPL